MANDKKMVEAITSMDEDFAQWYTDVVLKAGLIAYTNVKGCMAIKPAGYAIWELIQKQLDERFKATGVENVYIWWTQSSYRAYVCKTYIRDSVLRFLQE